MTARRPHCRLETKETTALSSPWAALASSTSAPAPRRPKPARVPQITGEDLLAHLQDTGQMLRCMVPLALHLIRAGVVAEAAKAQRVKALTERSRARSLAIREGIRRAIGALPDHWGAAGIVQRRIERSGPKHYGLKAVPDLEVIRDVLREKKRTDSDSASAIAADSLR